MTNKKNVLFLRRMKKTLIILGFSFIFAWFFTLPVKALTFQQVPNEILISTPTPTPTPTPTVNFKIAPKVIQKMSIVTSAVTPTPESTPTTAEVQGIETEVSPTVSEVEEAGSVTPTLAPAAPVQGGIQFKELIFIGIICFLTLIIILQIYLGGSKSESSEKPQEPQE